MRAPRAEDRHGGVAEGGGEGPDPLPERRPPCVERVVGLEHAHELEGQEHVPAEHLTSPPPKNT